MAAVSRHIRRIGALALGIGGVACGGGGDGSSTATSDVPATTPAAPATTPAAAGAAVPAPLEFTAPLLGGGELDARTYAGRPLALWFWAPY